MKFRLTRNEKSNLSRFVKRTKDKMEYVRASAILMRSKGMKVKQVASSLQVCMGAVFKWEREALQEEWTRWAEGQEASRKTGNQG